MRCFKLIFLLAILSCADKDFANSPYNELNVTPTKISVYEAESLKKDIDSIFFNRRFVRLSKESPFIVSISKIVNLDSTIYVLDNRDNKVLRFDLNGNYLGNIGKRGHGPGEFINVLDIVADVQKNEVLLLCDEKKAILRYSNDGKFLGAIKLDFFVQRFEILDDDKFGFFIGYDDEHYSNFKITDRLGNLTKKLFPFPRDLKPEVFDFAGGIFVNSEGLLYNDATHNTIFQIQKNGYVYPKYLIDFGSKTFEGEGKYNFVGFNQAIRNFEISYLDSKFFEMNDILTFKYTDLNIEKYAFYNVTSGELIINDHFESMLINEVLSSVIGVLDKNYFISQISVESYLNSNFSPEDSEFVKKYPVLSNLMMETKEDSNPILMFFQVKF